MLTRAARLKRQSPHVDEAFRNHAYGQNFKLHENRRAAPRRPWGSSEGRPKVPECKRHPVAVHIRELEQLMFELSSDVRRESDAVRRVQLFDRIESLKWVLKCYRICLELEERRVRSKGVRSGPANQD